MFRCVHVSSADEAKIQTAIRHNYLHAERETKDRGSKWHTRSLEEISTIFDTVTNSLTISEVFNTSICYGAPAVAVHWMEYEEALRTLQREANAFDAGIAVSLGEQIIRELKEADATIGITRIPGDVLDPQTYINAATTIESTGHKHAGLVLWDAQAGLFPQKSRTI